ncbi:MAG TPA: hypothetical protein VII82_00590 [Polyangiaceae bacterium]
MLRTYLPFTFLLAAGVAGGACSSSAGSTASKTVAKAADAGAATPTPFVFEQDSPAVYVAKVKNLLVGLPPTDAEVMAVTSDPTQIKTLIDGWMMLPQYQSKMLRFFELAFQQTQLTIADFADQVYPRTADVNATTGPLFVQNVTESFARTMLALVGQGAPFTQAATTTQFMMTPALMEFYAFLDDWQVDDAGKVTDRMAKANPGLTITAEASKGPIPITETLDPTSANYMHWYDPDVGTAASLVAEGCTQDPLVYPGTSDTLHYLLVGALGGLKGTTCTLVGGSAAAPQLTAADYSTWKMVTIRAPAAGESPTAFYDLPTLRTSNELVLTVPRIGFFSTLAFFANWQTNTSNQARVTTNQALIVALGSQVDGTDATNPPTTPGLDTVHASQAACVGCHRTLDPTRSIMASTYSWDYHNQVEAEYEDQQGLFAFENVIKPMANITDFATTLATHPLFAQAWAQKLCYYANSSPCQPTDPEFQRIVGIFTSSNYQWNALVREIFASPITTNATSTVTRTDEGKIIAVSRRDHLCAALDARLGFPDICSLDASTPDGAKTTIPEIVSGLPSDGYGRGAVAPVLPNQPTLFYRAGTENICEDAAALVIDVPMAKQIAGVKQWSSAQSTAAIADMVQTVMGLTPSDPRSASAEQVLGSHFAAAMTSGATATAALQSTFVAACLAPSAVSIGM